MNTRSPQTFLNELRRNIVEPQEGKSSKRRQLHTSRDQLAINEATSRHKKFLKVKSVSGGTAAVIWNKKRIIIFLENEEMRYSIDFQRLPIEKPAVFEAYERCNSKPKTYVTYAIATDDCIILGNNYGCLARLPEEVTRKVHTGEILHIVHRKNLLLTCSDDSTSMLLDSATLQCLSLVKDETYMKEVPLQGHFIDDFRIAICSKLYVKVYGLASLPVRIDDTLLRLDIVTEPTTRFVLHNDVLLYNIGGRIRYAILDKMADTNHVQSTLDLRQTRVDCFCLMSEGRLAIASSPSLKALRLSDGQLLWSLSFSAINLTATASVVVMEYSNNELFIMDNETNCIRLPVPSGIE